MKRIAIIGAGVAGLAAAEVLATLQDVEVILFEARKRIGGRAFTDTRLRTTEGPIPFDMGCHWIHGVVDNPLSHISDEVSAGRENPRYRYAPIEDEVGAQVFSHGELDAGASKALGDCADHLFFALQRAIIQDDQYVEANLAFSASELLWRTRPESFADPMFAQASWLRHAMEQSRAAPDFLAGDYIRSESELASNRGPRVDGSNGLVPLGLGALVQAWGQDLLDTKAGTLRLLLEAPVSKVVKAAHQYRLTYRQFGGPEQQSDVFDAVLVTVPTEIIRRGHLTFQPALPAPIAQAFESLPMGNYKKIALQFPKGTLGDFVDPGRRYVSKAVGEGAIPIFVGVIERDDLAVLMTFDRWASHFDDLPPLEFARRAVANLHAMVGGAVSLETLVDYSVTDWRKDPFALGAYAYTQVGKGTFQARTLLLNRMKNNTLLFAGEAITELAAGSAHGAWWSGNTAATELVATLGLGSGVDIHFEQDGTRTAQPAAKPGGQRITLTPGASPTRIVIRTGQ
jgi:hypothetical protein